MGGGAATVQGAGKEMQGRMKITQRRLPGSEGHWSSLPPSTNLPPQHPLVDVLSIHAEVSQPGTPKIRKPSTWGIFTCLGVHRALAHL